MVVLTKTLDISADEQAQLDRLGPRAKTHEGHAVLTAIRKRKVAEAIRDQKVCRIFAILCAVALPVSLYFFGPQPWTYFFPFGMFMAHTGREPGPLSKKEYYSIPGSRTNSGAHTCIYCGHRKTKVEYWGRSGTSSTTYCGHCGERAY